MRELADLRHVAEPQIDALEPPAAFDENLCRAIHEHVRDFAVVQERLQRTKPEKLRAERLELVLGQVRRYGGTNPLS